MTTTPAAQALFPVTAELMPCPFCGGTDVVPVCVYHPNGYAIGCIACRTKGPLYKAANAADLPAEAVSAWNTRAALTPSPCPGDGMLTFLRECVEEARSDHVGYHESNKPGEPDTSKYDAALQYLADLTPSALSDLQRLGQEYDGEAVREALERVVDWHAERGADDQILPADAQESWIADAMRALQSAAKGGRTFTEKREKGKDLCEKPVAGLPAALTPSAPTCEFNVCDGSGRFTDRVDGECACVCQAAPPALSGDAGEKWSSIADELRACDGWGGLKMGKPENVVISSDLRERILAALPSHQGAGEP